MKRTFLFALLLASAFPTQASAQEGHQPQHIHSHDMSEKLGQVNFTISCNPQAQKQFNRAVAWLHSFEYEEAEKAFTEVTVTDPRCGMGYWGIAMSTYHQIWAPPTIAELQKGSSVVEKARVVGARTQRERDYIAALEVFYQDSDKLDHKARTFAYSEAMKQLHQRYPSDSEAGVFYALTLITTGMMTNDKTYARQKEAAQILNRILAREPNHPGVAHYLIHSYDYPALAQLALPAARSYAKIAPASAHARHMPSHIFTRLGLWQEGIRSNLDAEAAAKAFAVRNHLSGAWDEQLHSMDYLAYAYLQGAQDKRAWGVLDELNKIQKAEPETFKVAYAAAAIPARYALERRRWDEAAKLTLPPDALRTFPWQRFRWAQAHIHFARAIGAARTSDTTSARQEVEKLTAIRQSLLEVKGDYDWATQVEIERLVASAWLEYAEGKHEESVRLMRAAADLDDATEKHPVTPGAILPAREELGELLLELKHPAAALKEFETSLRSAPNRFNGLYGAARAARLAPDQRLARIYYGKLLELCRHADSTRPELEEAKAFVKTTGANANDQRSVGSRMPTAQIALSPCQIEGVPGPAHCGTYRVWEDRITKRGRQIELSIIVLDALGSPRQPDPFLFLQGGPGDAPSFNARFYSHVFADLRRTRDLVLVDLRGTGKSSALTCPELGQPDAAGVLDSDLLGVPAVRACRERLEKSADLRQYTTEIAVDDLDEVRQALGYKQLNLYGTSYGTRVAQVYMRRHPSSLRTVSLKGIVPPSLASPATHARSGEEAWQRLVQRCQADESCARSYPTLDVDLRTLLKRLEDSPALPLARVSNGPLKIKVSPGLFAEAFRNLLYSPESAAGAPRLLWELTHTNRPGLSESALSVRRLLSGVRLAAGFFLSVSCTEDIPYLPKNIAALAAGTFGGDYRLRQQIQACTVWPRGAVSAQHRRPTKSSIPTLLLSGEFDPVTPPPGGAEVLRGLTHGLHVVIRNNGHPIGSAEQCIGKMIGAFIDKGSTSGLDYSCASTIPAVPFALQ